MPHCWQHTSYWPAEDVFIALNDSIAFYPPPHTDLHSYLVTVTDAANITWALPTRPPSPVHTRLNTIMYALRVSIRSDPARLHLLELFAEQHDWLSFWEFWRSFPRVSLSRSAAMYTKMFNLVADTNHQTGCMTVLRAWVPEMEAEAQPVELEGDVLYAVERCLRVADPEGLSFMQNLMESTEWNEVPPKGEWPRLWQRCAEARLKEIEEQ